LKPSRSLLRLALPDFDTKFAITSNVTFLEIVYPDEELLNNNYNNSRYDVNLHEGLRDSVYSLFCIISLRYLSIKSARTWEAFILLSLIDSSRVGTSNIVSLLLPNTVALSRDLTEILTWPKALRYFYHDISTNERRNYFQNYGSEQLASPNVFIEGLNTQRHVVVGLMYNNVEDCSGSDDTTFGTALREFVNLKRLALSRDCLFGDGEIGESQPLYETLPPNLEEALI